jgi:DNA-binding MarR family transcriptional regulator
MVEHAARHVLADRVLEVLPDWVNTITQLNGLIAERMGVVASDLDCLHALNRHGPATASVLAKRVGLTAGSVSRMIDRLGAAGCVERVPDPGDRRRILIEPTAEGLDRVAAYYARLTARTREDLHGVDEDALHALVRFFEAARDSAAAEVDQLRSTPTTVGSARPSGASAR